MIFHSIEYLTLLAASATAYWLVPARARWAILCLGGAAMLATVGLVHAIFAIAFALANHRFAVQLERLGESPAAKRLLIAAIGIDVAALGLCKYVPPLGRFAARHGFEAQAALATSIILPLGISYYTFQAIGYLLEVYWGRASVEPHAGRFTASLLFFPKIVSGPIERPDHFLPQIDGARFDAGAVLAGVRRMAWGLFKKAVVADRVGRVITPVYDHPDAYSGAVVVLTIALYIVQVYADFSGYTDIALGTAKCFGIDLIPNFNRPFSARSVTDFWRRWHISLSSWTNDYIYKPLAMAARGSRARVLGAAVLTFVILGAWHGARATFVVFGLLHGVAVALEALRKPVRGAAKRDEAGPSISNVATITFYALTCVFFRVATVAEAIHFFSRIPPHAGTMPLRTWLATAGADPWIVAAVIAGVLLSRVRERREARREARIATTTPARPPGRALTPWGTAAAVSVLIGAIVVLGVAAGEFVYEQF